MTLRRFLLTRPAILTSEVGVQRPCAPRSPSPQRKDGERTRPASRGNRQRAAAASRDHAAPENASSSGVPVM